MKLRPFIVGIALVVAPTAVLSIMAAGAVRVREASLQRRLEATAEQAVRSVSDTVGAYFAGIQADLGGTMRTLLREGKPDGILPAAARLRHSYDVVDQVCVVRLPDTFLYPADPIADREPGFAVSPPEAAPATNAATIRLRGGWGKLEDARAIEASGDHEAAAREFQKIISEPGVRADVRAEAAIAAAKCYDKLGRFEFAAGILRQTAGYSSGEMAARKLAREPRSGLRNPGGCLYSMIALRELTGTYRGAAAGGSGDTNKWHELAVETEVELLDHLVFLHDFIVPAQRNEILLFLDVPRAADDGRQAEYARRFGAPDTAGHMRAFAEKASYLAGLLLEYDKNSAFTAEERADLLGGLARYLEQATVVAGPLMVKTAGALWSCGPATEDGSAVAAFRVDPAALEEYISKTVFFAGERHGLVIVRERLVPSAGAFAGKTGSGQGAAGKGELLASGRLPWPFDDVVLKAYPEDPDAFRRDVELRARLHEWGILVLAFGIVGGAWVALRSASVEVQRARARSDIVAGVSHDLKTPLSSMRMLGESLYLERVKDPGRQKEFLRTIVNESNRLGHLVERILYFVRLGEDALEYQRREIDLGAVVRDSVEIFAGIPDARIRVDIAADLPMIVADPDAMGQVVLNLVDNAVKYSRKAHTLPADGGGGAGEARRPVEVEVTVARRGGEVEIAVRDRGPGIGRGEMKKIFRRYYRGEADRETVSGTGLGLALCRHVVRAHGGRIWAESEPGRGSVFRVVLPAGRVNSEL